LRTMRNLWARTGAIAWLLAAALASGAAEERAVKTRVPPVYPEIAKRMRITGIVKLDATVDADGKVIDVKTISGFHVLSVAAEEAVRKWRFAPADAQSTESVEIRFERDQ
jgi:TonB family protein